MTAAVLGMKGVQAIERRGISAETAARFGVYTARADRDGVIADAGGNVVVFPFLEHGIAVAEKYRAPGRRFWQRAGGRRTFWNADVLDDPALASGAAALIITEGEIDALTAIDCGFPFTVSVPDGAPAVPKGKSPDELDEVDPAKEGEGKFEFVWNNRDRLKRIKRFVLAVDSDGPGQRLAAELVRRLSAGRCLFVTYPTDAVVSDGDSTRPCKDLNEVLVHYGRDAVVRVLNEARPYPVRGLYRLSDYPGAPSLEVFATGWSTLDRHLGVWRGETMLVTGIPSHGKSTFATNLLVNMAEAHGWRSVICSPEMPIVPQYRDKIRSIRLRRQPRDERDVADADAWIDRYFSFIDPTPIADLTEEVTLEWVLERATDAVLRDGVDVLLIDPWNELEHERRAGETTSEMISRLLRVAKRWTKQHGIMVILVAHPTKDVGKDGKARMPTPYDVDGSAHWYNKPDHVLVVHRPDEDVNETIIRVAKVRFEGTGSKGFVKFRFDTHCSRYDLLATQEDLV